MCYNSLRWFCGLSGRTSFLLLIAFDFFRGLNPADLLNTQRNHSTKPLPLIIRKIRLKMNIYRRKIRILINTLKIHCKPGRVNKPNIDSNSDALRMAHSNAGVRK